MMRRNRDSTKQKTARKRAAEEWKRKKMTFQYHFLALYKKLEKISINMKSNNFSISAVLNIPLLESIK